jgi:hypothetical protein
MSTVERTPSGAFVGHRPRKCGPHTSTGARAWCGDCAEWCYPSIPCGGCALGIAEDIAAGIAWSQVVDQDVERIVAAPDDYALEVLTVDAFLLAAHRRQMGRDLAAHLFRIRTAHLARRLELNDVKRARATARADYLPGGGYAAQPWPDGDPWSHALPEPCL